ncbi:hypothetical protein [Qipengyuania sp. JC766]|uniref:hypothetical protein n=1 Tax=Qipengyuania sp. JC766 TaxID=3232139 RepID=UPI0034594CBC
MVIRVLVALGASALALGVPAVSAAQDATPAIDGVAAEKACKKLKGKAAQDPTKLEACHNAGRAYGTGDYGVSERSAALSEEYLAKACNGGLGKSCSLLSWYYLDNSAYQTDAAVSRKWDEKGCEVGDATACSGMGYWLGEDGDIEAAKQYYRKAIELRPDYEYAKKKLAELEAKQAD